MNNKNNYTNDYDSEIEAKYESLKEEGAFDKMRHETNDYLYSDLQKFDNELDYDLHDDSFNACEPGYLWYEFDEDAYFDQMLPMDQCYKKRKYSDTDQNSLNNDSYFVGFDEEPEDGYYKEVIFYRSDITEDECIQLMKNAEQIVINEYDNRTETKDMSLKNLIQTSSVVPRIRHRNGLWYFYSDATDSFSKVSRQKIEELFINSIPRNMAMKLTPKKVGDILFFISRHKDYALAEDKRPDLVKCLNGTYIISEKFLDQSSRPECNFDYCINANYKSGVTLDDAPVFKKFLDTSLEGNPIKIKSVLQTIGYLLSDRYHAKKAFILYGKSNSGKSVLLKLIEHMMGSDNVSNISLHKLDDRFLTAELAENRLNINAEISEIPLASIDTFKLIVGADTLTAEKKGQDPFRFRCQCKLLFAGNLLPKLKNIGYTDAFFDRLHIINFNTSITQKDRDLESKLQGEVDVIFSLAMNELSELVSSNYNFAVSDDSNSVINEYRKNIDSVESFISECCTFDEKAITAKDELYQEYCTYCKETGINEISEKTFDKEFLKKNPAVSGKKSRCGGIYKNPKSCYVGVQINSNKEEADIDDIR